MRSLLRCRGRARVLQNRATNGRVEASTTAPTTLPCRSPPRPASRPDRASEGRPSALATRSSMRVPTASRESRSLDGPGAVGLSHRIPAASSLLVRPPLELLFPEQLGDRIVGRRPASLGLPVGLDLGRGRIALAADKRQDRLLTGKGKLLTLASFRGTLPSSKRL
jgi:hypothetical protein